MTMDEHTDILAQSPDNSCSVVTEAGVEYSRPKLNQDTFYIDENQMVYAVFDGHGKNGHLCSAFCRTHLRSAIESSHAGSGALTAKELCSALVRVDDLLKKEAQIDCKYSGTTATCCAVTPDSIISAWLGDSRAIMGRWAGTELSLVELSQDHKPELPAERRRILKAGGRVRQIVDEHGNKAGGFRVFVPSKDIPGVSFSRSVGDEVIHAYGVSSEVDCIVTPRTGEDRFMVVGSDGIFEFIDNLEVLKIVSGCQTVDQAAALLVKTAKERWMKMEEASDDSTAIVIKLPPTQDNMTS